MSILSKKKILIFKYIVISIGLTSSIIPLYLFPSPNKSFLPSTQITETKENTILDNKEQENRSYSPLSFPTTSIDMVGINNIVQNDLYPNQVVENKLKNDMIKYIIDPPPGFSYSNIIFDKFNPIIATGEIEISIVLNRYYTVDGIQKEPKKFGNITLTGYGKIGGETIINSNGINVDNDLLISSEYYKNSKFIIKILKDQNIIENLPSNAIITFASNKFSNTEGKVSIDIYVSSYFNNELEYINPQSRWLLKQNFIISGFKKLSKTIFNNFDIKKPDVLASEYIVSNKAELIEGIIKNTVNFPSTATPDNIIISTYNADNSKGSIQLTITSTLNYEIKSHIETLNPNGTDVVINNIPIVLKDLIITGFKNISTTTFSAEIESNKLLELAQKQTNSSIIELLMKDIEKVNFIAIKPENIRISSRVDNNLKGTITISPMLDKYVNEDYIIVDKPGEFKIMPQVLIKGYKIVKPTALDPKFILSPEEKEITASDAFLNKEKIKQKIFDNILIDTRPPELNLSNIIILSESYNNKLGTISILFTLSEYYASDGTYFNTDGNWYNKFITISGYKKVTKTIIKKQINVVGQENISPQLISDKNIVEYIKSNINEVINPIPSSFNLDTNLKINQINKNNYNGTITVFLIIDNFYNEQGEQVTNNSMGETVTFRGYKSTLPTEILSSVSLPEDSPQSNISPGDVTQEQLINIIYNSDDNSSILFKNLPPKGPLENDFSINNIIILIKSAVTNKNESYIIFDVSLSTYYNQDGVLISNSNTYLSKKNIKLSGFKRVEKTVISDELFVKKNSDFGAMLPSDFVPMISDDTSPNKKNSVELMILENKDLVFQNYPEDIFVNNITILSIDNLTGQIIINISILNYYNSIGKTESIIPLTQTIKISNLKSIIKTTIQPEYLVPFIGSLETDVFLPSTLDSVKIKKIIWDNKEFIFNNLPNNFSDKDFKIDLLSNSYDNLNGTILINIKLTKYFNDFGDLETLIPLYQNILLTGFKHIFPTTIVPEITINNMSDTLPTEFFISQLVDFLFNSRSSIFYSTPDDFSKSDIIIGQNAVKANNLLGEIIIDPLSISNYYNNEGKIINSFSKKLDSKIVITGFKKISKKTTISESISLIDSNFSTLSPSQINSNDLKTIIFSNGIIKSPTLDFSSDDIIISDSDIISRNNNKGTLEVEVKIKNYYKEDGSISDNSSDLLTGKLKITGLLQTFETTASKDNILINGISSIIPSKILIPQLLEIVRDNYSSIFENLPVDFSDTNITNIFVESFNNVLGTLNIKIILNRYNDRDGIMVNTGATKEFKIVIEGFKGVSKTTIEKSINVNYGNEIASSLTITNILDILLNFKDSIFQNLPDNFNKSNIIIKNPTPDNFKGILKFDLLLNSYINDEGRETNDSDINFIPLQTEFTINGFSKISKTIIVPSVEILGNNLISKLPSEVNLNDIKNIINRDIDSFIKNGPNLNINDLSILIKEKNNIKGTITIELLVSKYYNAEGQLITSGMPLTGAIILTGFSSIEPTIFHDNVILNSLSSILPEEVTPIIIQQNILEYKNLFFENIPFSFNKNNLNINKIKSFNNLDGSLIVDVSVNNYYDKDGFLTTNIYKQLTIKILGLKKSLESTINDNVWITNFPSDTEKNIPSYFFTNVEKLKKLVVANRFSIFNNIPDLIINSNEAFFNNLNVEPISYNNRLGQITINVSINQYYNNLGVTVIGKLSKQITLTNFNEVFPTIIETAPLHINGYTDRRASSFTKEEATLFINERIRDIVSNFPGENNPGNIQNILVDKTNDTNGSLIIKFSIINYYDNDGILQINKPMNGSITVFGFEQIFPTTINEIEIGTQNSISVDLGNSNYLPSEINKWYSTDIDSNLVENQNKMNEYFKKIILGSIKNFPGQEDKTDLIVKYRENSDKDSDGTLVVNVNIRNYNSSVTGSQEKDFFYFQVKIGGYKVYRGDVITNNNIIVISSGIIASIVIILIIGAIIMFIRFRFLRKTV